MSSRDIITLAGVIIFITGLMWWLYDLKLVQASRRPKPPRREFEIPLSERLPADNIDIKELKKMLDAHKAATNVKVA